MRYSVTIDCFPESAALYRDDHAIIAIDVIRATTTALTSLATGRRCFPVKDVQSALQVANRLSNPLLCGEVGGVMPQGFEMNNSPAELHERADVERPLILLSSSGTKLMCNSRGAETAYVACFRNAAATALHVAGRHAKIAVIGAGSRGDFRIEDQICCAWIAGALVELGYSVADPRTDDIIGRFRYADAGACLDGASANYLRRSGQVSDLDFILDKVNDLNDIAILYGEEIIAVAAEELVPERAVAGAH